MKQRKDDAELERAYQELLGEHVEEWDASIEPPPIGDEAFVRLVRDGKELSRRRRRLERYAFWLVSVIVLGGLLLVWQSSLVWFAVLQMCVFGAAGAALIAGAFKFGKARRQRL